MCWGSAHAKQVVWWLEPYANLTSIDAYKAAWHQFADNRRPGYVCDAVALAAVACISYVEMTQLNVCQYAHS